MQVKLEHLLEGMEMQSEESNAYLILKQEKLFMSRVWHY